MSDDTPIPARNELESRLAALTPTLDELDASDGVAAAAELNRRLPFDGGTVQRIRTLCDEGLEAGWLVPREAGPAVRFGRLAKDLGGYAVDVVLMREGSGRGHAHPRGEFNMCFPIDGAPRFDGREPGWVVCETGSHHVPTVTGGTMLFVYFTPGGEVEWD